MSNRAVSATYRTIIDDVISNVRQDFEDMGIEREVLEELQRVGFIDCSGEPFDILFPVMGIKNCCYGSGRL